MAFKKKSAADGKNVVVPDIQQQVMYLRLVGRPGSPLVVHQFSEKAKGEMRDKQQKKAKLAKAAKNPEAEFEGARYRMPTGQDAFPAITIKNALVASCSFADGVTQKHVKGGIYVNLDTDWLCPIESDMPTMREDVVRVGGLGKGTGTADLRYRPEYRNWSIPIRVTYSESIFTAEQVFNLFRLAGFHIGIGEWRPEKGGQWGMFNVVSEADAMKKAAE